MQSYKHFSLVFLADTKKKIKKDKNLREIKLKQNGRI